MPSILSWQFEKTMEDYTPKYSFSAVTLKAKRYCDKAERAHKDVLSKLIRWGMNSEERDQIMMVLISENLLNEERYAEAFVNDKYRFNKWGVKKIEQALKMKGVSDRNIRDAIAKIVPAEYEDGLKELIEKRWLKTAGIPVWQRKMKVARYFISRGYESSLIWKMLEGIS